MANINRAVKRGIAVGCNHGIFACKTAQDNVIAFRDRFKPHVVIDLGDVHDFTAFRTGAKGSKDEAADIELDFNSGAEWLKRYRPTHRTNGNHDHRIYKLIGHHNAVLSYAASCVAESIRQIDEKNKTLVRPYHQKLGWWKFGGTSFGHGWMYNEQAIRDHAETYGNCVIAHLHKPGQEFGRRIDQPIGTCVGTLIDPDRAEYAHTNRSWLRWAHGLVNFEFTDTWCDVRLVQTPCMHGETERWPFPL